MALFDGAGRASFSSSDVDTVEHMYYNLPADGLYSLRVTNHSDVETTFAMALWSKATPIPEPATLSLLLAGVLGLGIRRPSGPARS